MAFIGRLWRDSHRDFIGTFADRTALLGRDGTATALSRTRVIA